MIYNLGVSEASISSAQVTDIPEWYGYTSSRHRNHARSAHSVGKDADTDHLSYGQLKKNKKRMTEEENIRTAQRVH